MASLRADQTIGVIGAGTMGAGIAQIAAAAGHLVLRFDVRPDAAGRALQDIDLALQRMAKGKVTEADRRALTDRITPDRYRVSPLLRRKMFSGGRFR